jgi:NADPH:quinone reductase-like Zn-dependent oxidoreductase
LWSQPGPQLPACFIDVKTEDFRATVKRVDAVIDLVGEPVTSRSFQAIRPGGILVSTVAQPDAELARRHGTEATFMLVDATTRALETLSARFDSGEIAAKVGTVLPLCRARLAHELLSNPTRQPGKIVLQVI